MKMEELEKSIRICMMLKLLHDSVITLLSKNRILNESIFLEVSIAFV
jgi:hypothetical protein